MNQRKPAAAARCRLYMKQKLVFGLVAQTLVSAALSQSPDLYENWTRVQCPPEIPPTIDAVNFVNHAEFLINFTNFTFSLPVTAPPYETSSTANYTNDFGALMSCNTGFRMETKPLSGPRQRASTLYNNGTIDCGTLGTSNVIIIGDFLFNLTGTGEGVKCQVNATNIFNPGTINMGFGSLLTLRGENLDLSGGTLAMENNGFSGFNGGIFFNAGIFDGYWGVGDPVTQRPIFYPNGISPVFYYETAPPRTQIHVVTNRSHVVTEQQLGGPTFVPYLLDVIDQSGSNRTVRAVFLSNTNPAIEAKVYFPAFAGDSLQLGPDVVEWSWVHTNITEITTNYLYLEDDFLSYTNFQVIQNGFAGIGFNRPTFIPWNYTFFRGGPLSLGAPAAPTLIPFGTFDPGTPNGSVTNEWTAYQAMFLPGSAVMGEVAGQNVTNQSGRIELTADKYLVLSNAQVSSVSYLLMKATNHFGGSAGARIAAPHADVYLRSTNGLLTLTNVLVPALPRPIGICDLFSARWTNIIAGITNRFHVLFADTQLAPTSPLMIQTLNLSSVTNPATGDDSVFISDVFNVTSNLLIDTCRLTLTTNAPDAATPAGTLNYLNPSVLWPTATPRLKYLTNHGGIQGQNVIVFGGSQSSPYTGPTTSTNPYAAFVNTGGVTNYGSFIFASYFQNSGTFQAGGGAIQLRQAQTAILTNGSFLAPASAGSITIQAGDLMVSNHLLHAGNSLTLSVSNRLDDGSLNGGVEAVTNRNTWRAGYGINLPVRPALSSLLATTITNIGPAGSSIVIVPNSWAGEDRGPVAAGYSNNAALGRLILVGLTNTTQFRFQPATATNNALYVDYLEFRDYMTNFDSSGNLANLRFDPGMKIYYGQIIINGVSWAEKLNGKNSGGLNWVPGYAGAFSSTNMLYPDGTTNLLNLALVQSCSLDSNCNGIPNCADPAPVLVPSQVNSLVNLTAALTQGTNVVLSWSGVPFRRNYLEFKPSLTATNWEPLTNVTVPGPECSQQQVVDPANGGSGFYRLRVETAP